MTLRRMARRAPGFARDFARDESGVISVNSIFMVVACCAVGASAVDVTHFYEARAQLQVSADIAAHAALYNRTRPFVTAAVARERAIAAVEAGMDPGTYGDVIDAADIVYGTWDYDNRTFEPMSDSAAFSQATLDAVKADPTIAIAAAARTHREDASSNPVSSFLFRITGIDQVNVAAMSVFVIYQPECVRDGFVADDIVDVQSNGGYFDGFCMHANNYVSLNSNNYFEDGTIVSMPDLALLDIPNSGLATNDGLQEALHENYYAIKILDRIRVGARDPLDTAIGTAGDDDRPAYLTGTDPAVRTISSNTSINPTQITPNAINRFNCPNTSRTLTLTRASGATEALYSNAVIMTNCMLSISGRVRLENSVVYSTNVADDAIRVNSAGGSALWLGRADACANGGGAQIITRGGFRSSAEMTINGGQIITLGPVKFAAGSSVTGIGASITSGGTIDGASNISMTGCLTGMEANFTEPYFRPVY